ncbi:unnamed protein product [Acanthoscelides obtectus]|uniref:Tesmin/TSO1-like CXC domain-containing protein n=1 Tax=Acanthoscelides obtectus TaxID=200917 RepID=A0A9P0JN27_ACAOB|nr:unnamed protein product [Acanthoscelides obtectus]CAK1661567.1 hypothetical protein AOBTE_LOCUS22687 [Acanthoscelides obtectus]
MSEADPAPKELLQRYVSCGCQGPCKSKRCNCRKAGLKCNPACKVCRGKSCNNSKRWTATEHHDSETPTTTDACEEDGGRVSFTKWPEAIPVPNQETQTVALALLDYVFSRFGVYMKLQLDRGRNIEVFTQLMEKLGM